MKRIEFVTFMIILFASAFLVYGCSTTTSTSSTGSGYFTIILTHYGVDFSAQNTSDGTVSDLPTTESDGETISWAPADTTAPAGAPSGSMWWRSSYYISTNEATIKDYGSVESSSVTAIPSTWDGTPGATLEPLALNHVYVVECLDGYAKFKVLELPPVGAAWNVTVEAYYTSGTSFDG